MRDGKETKGTKDSHRSLCNNWLQKNFIVQLFQVNKNNGFIRLFDSSFLPKPLNKLRTRTRITDYDQKRLTYVTYCKSKQSHPAGFSAWLPAGAQMWASATGGAWKQRPLLTCRGSQHHNSPELALASTNPKHLIRYCF